jgi:hypothetical protein
MGANVFAVPSMSSHDLEVLENVLIVAQSSSFASENASNVALSFPSCCLF